MQVPGKKKGPARTGAFTDGPRLGRRKTPEHIRQINQELHARETAQSKELEDLYAAAEALEAKSCSATNESGGVELESKASESPVAKTADAYEGADAKPSLFDKSAKADSTESKAESPDGEAPKRPASLTRFQYEVDRGRAHQVLEENRSLTKSERTHKQRKEWKVAGEHAVKEVLTEFREKIELEKRLQSDDVVDHIVARNIHKRQDNWNRQRRDTDWYRNFLLRSDQHYWDDELWFEAKERDTSSERAVDNHDDYRRNADDDFDRRYQEYRNFDAAASNRRQYDAESDRRSYDDYARRGSGYDYDRDR